ncbi:MAG: hypothetical protein PHI35_00695 [Victivallaceae bacterium]|nr:hypothetical protein [Victivallaceae bacterium]
MKPATVTLKRVGLLYADFCRGGHISPEKMPLQLVGPGEGRQNNFRELSDCCRAILFTLASLVLVSSNSRAAEVPAVPVNRPLSFVVSAIARQESRGGQVASSDAGRSVGHCMMQAGAWADVNKLRAARGARCYPFAFASVPAINREYAAEYFADLGKRLARALRRPATVAEIYAAYNQGFAKFAKRRFSLAASPPASRRASAKVERDARASEQNYFDARFAALVAEGRALCQNKEAAK